MFKSGEFISHSGKKLNWKIECDSLDRVDITTLAEIISSKFRFGRVCSPPTNSHFVLDLVRLLEHYHADRKSKTVLIVDDVVTTGRSLRVKRKELISQGVKPDNITGVVIFSRGGCPVWATPMFTLNRGWRA